jgi:phosphoesterase RecJ-like protein
VAVLLDFSRWDRIGRLEGPIRNSGALTVCIDHHPGTGGPADLNGIDTGASSTGQLVYELLRPLGHPFDPRMATGFYVSILTDTGSFRFSNSDPRAHRAAAELLAHGLEPSRLYEHVYGNWSVGRLRLLGRVLDAMRLEAGGRIILLPVPRESIDATGADSTDAEGFVDIARSAAVCRCVVLLLEQRDGRIKVSLRSKGTVDVNAVAGRLGGGGHLYAAATVLDGPLDAAARAVLAELVPALDAAPDEGAAR